MDYHKLPFFAESWNVAFRKKKKDSVLDDLGSPFTVIRNSDRYWAADPFVYEYGDDVYVFAELYDYVSRKGIIGYYILNKANSKWTPVITEPYHLSFPYVFREDDQIFIMPESSQSSSLYLYRAVDFPDHWEKCEDLRSNVKYVDTTPFLAFGRKMGLTYGMGDHNLRILDFSDGEDRVVETTHTELKRPAGYFDFQRGIRAAQNCEEDYGKGLILYHFIMGEDLSYQEEEIRRVFPQDLKLTKKLYLDGIHTYNASKNYEVVDIKTRRFNLINLFFRIVSKILKRHTPHGGS